MFSLSFLNSGLLIASLTALIPFLIYFFAKKKPKKLVFSSIRFIQASKEEKKSRINLKNILLLIVRSLIILLLVILFARPIATNFLNLDSNSHAPTTVSVIADNSLSMDYYASEVNRLALLKNSLKKINKKITDKDYIRIYTKDNHITSQRFMQGPIADSLISNIPLSYSNISLDSLVATAYNDLQESKTINNELYLFTDGNEKLSLVDSLIQVNYVNLDSEKVWSNLTAEIKSAQIISNNNQKQISIDCLIYNYSEYDISGRMLRLNLNNQSFDRFINIEAKKTWNGNFTIPLETSGWQNGYIEIQDEYFIPDNRAYISFFFNLNPQITVISDKEISLPLKTMMNIYCGKEDNVNYISQDQVNNQLLSTTDIFVLYKLDFFSAKTTSLIDKLNQEGRGALIVLSSQHDRAISDFVKNNFSIEINTGINRNQIPDWYNTHNSFLTSVAPSQFRDMNFNDLVNSQILSKIFTLLAVDQQAVLALNNDFFLFLFDDNNDLVTHSAYPVLMNKIFEQLSNSNLQVQSKYVGQRIEVANGAKINDQDLISNSFQFNQPGIYKLSKPGNKLEYYAVNLNETQLQESISTQDSLSGVYQDITDDWEEHLFKESGSFDLKKTLLLLILSLFVIELLVVKLLK